MSLYSAEVGEVIIKPEFREDFNYFFHGEYTRVTTQPLAGFIKEYGSNLQTYFIPLLLWEHGDYKVEWKDKFKTVYDSVIGCFTFGVYYNTHGSRHIGMTQFLEDILPVLTDKVIYTDYYLENSQSDVRRA